MTQTIAVWSVALGLATLGALGCQTSHVGDPCVPEQEYDKSFLGFSLTEVSVESRSFQCQTRLCLVDHFQGRVSCPYGQAADGGTVAPATGCVTPGDVPVDGKDPVTGVTLDMFKQEAVLPQCTERTAADAVYCSCRCANANGQTNDGANYCKCPDGFSCTQLVSSVGAGNEGLTGAYCTKTSQPYVPGQCNTLTECDPKMANCGTGQGVTGK
jgi:hypothetical protein